MVGGLGITLLNNVDTVEIACLAQLINVIAPITTVRGGGVFKQTIYHPFHMLSKYGRGTTMKAAIEAPTYTSEFGELPIVESAVVYDETKEEIRVFALNCSQDEDTEFTVELQSYGNKKLKKHLALFGDDPEMRNTIDQPDNVVMKEMDIAETSGTTAVLPKMSWNVLILG